mmetsp:Transcript_164395/g.527226  ORF Transcript_164395/g.527226 Transcript_164395/m.527226 type:complete len:147 (+) Transcript_164395:348-788(+)
MWDVLHRPLAFSFLWSNLPKNQLWLFFPWLVLVGPVPYILAVCLLKIPGVEMGTFGPSMNTTQKNTRRVRLCIFRLAVLETPSGHLVQLPFRGGSTTLCNFARWTPERLLGPLTWSLTRVPMRESFPSSSTPTVSICVCLPNPSLI